MLVYVFAFSLLAAIGWHLSVRRFSVAVLGSVVSSVILGALLEFMFVGTAEPQDIAIFSVGFLFVSAVIGKLIARIRQR